MKCACEKLAFTSLQSRNWLLLELKQLFEQAITVIILRINDGNV